ncbi:hypothetical protein H4Q32_023449 [Labeo rohita]|uniref:Uncharacterized protein n=1 Tax=Labeo rohita TaxID=84645 RepID=A0ABQ8M8K4_LABRO|nr:hypothetical protein H4Q32_023449 [Labeo rohita]
MVLMPKITTSIREEILERRAKAEKKAEHKKLELIKEIKERQTLIRHYNDKLQQQQTELENICSKTRKWVKAYTHIHLEQGSQNSVQEAWCPLEFFSSLPQHTCLEVSSMPSKTLISWLRVYRLSMCSIGTKMGQTAFHSRKRDAPVCSNKGWDSFNL